MSEKISLDSSALIYEISHRQSIYSITEFLALRNLSEILCSNSPPIKTFIQICYR